MVKTFSTLACDLGEGPFWHFERGSWFWFDINEKKLIEKKNISSAEKIIHFDFQVSAAGIVDESRLLLASERGLYLLNLTNEKMDFVKGIEEKNPLTRSNDARIHPSGAFWIGTMGKKAEKKAGNIYWYLEGKLVLIFPKLTIPNSICFNKTGDKAYFTDTPTQKIMQVKVDPATGLPLEKETVFTDKYAHPDGSIVDDEGNLICAHWGSHEVIAYSQTGEVIGRYRFPASQVTCPALGGEKLNELLVTSAREGLNSQELQQDLEAGKIAGKTFLMETNLKGKREPLVKL